MKARRSSRWFLLKVAILLIGLSQGFFPSGLDEDEFSRASVVSLLIVALLSCIGVFLVSSLLLIARREIFTRPSWFLPPFSISNHIFVFDFSAYYFFSAGVGLLISSYTQNQPQWLGGTFVAMGIGLFLGVHGVLLAFKNRFAN